MKAFIAVIVLFVSVNVTAEERIEYPINLSKVHGKELAQAKKDLRRRIGRVPPINLVTKFPAPSRNRFNYRVSKKLWYPEYSSAGRAKARSSGSIGQLADTYAYSLGCHLAMTNRQCRSIVSDSLGAMKYFLTWTEGASCEAYRISRDRFNYVHDDCCYYIDDKCEGIVQ